MIGERMNFSLPVRQDRSGHIDIYETIYTTKRTHVCQVDVLRRENEALFLCRRTDNGSPIYAFEHELTSLKK